ncbi:MAG: type II toxin-antitoxin system VapC family toxin [Planctomycetota bacterium]
MKVCVVDASVVAAAFFPEVDADAAGALLASETELHAPDLIYAEFANVAWKRHRRHEIDEQEADDLLADFLRLPLQITPCSELACVALSLALRTGRTVYDSLYLALAVRLDAVMVSSDRRLVNALARRPLGEHVAWVGALD